MKFASIIKLLRENKEMTQEDLSKIVHLNRSTISKWETADTYPDISTLLFLAKYFDVSLDYLVNGEEKNNKNNMNMGDNNFSNQDDNISFNKLTPQELEILKIYNSFDLKKQVIFLSKIFEIENELK